MMVSSPTTDRTGRLRANTMKRSQGLLNLDEASLGSPITRKSPSRGHQNLKRKVDHLKARHSSTAVDIEIPTTHAASSPSIFGSSPPVLPESKMRKLSLDGSQPPPQQLLQAQQSQQQQPTKLLPIKLNASLTSEISTPDSYKFVKPLQTAFISTGLLSKRNRRATPSSVKSAPPETPCKRPYMSPFSANSPGFALSAGTPLAPPSNSSLFASHQMQLHQKQHRAFLPGASSHVPLSPQLPKSLWSHNDAPTRGDSRVRHPIDTSFSMNSMTSFDQDMPPTPTKTHDFVQQHPHSRRSSFSFSQDHSSRPQWLGNSPSEASTVSTMSTLSSGSPQTPHELSHMYKSSYGFDESQNNPPILQISTDAPKTPAKTPRYDVSSDLADYNGSLSSVGMYEDSFLKSRFAKVSLLGAGEFSVVYTVSKEDSNTAQKFAVKKTKRALTGMMSRKRQIEEVEILQQVSNTDVEGTVVQFIDAWEWSNHLYIMTEYCENGNLDRFLSERGNVSRLDEWRVWKILVELALGVKHIHQQGFLHLDLKPANIFITFEGNLKIGDFGMATSYPVAAGVEREGDREYIAPEILSSQMYDKPADIFSLGLIMLEIAANIVLPDNGVHWQKLRSGDLTDAGRLSSGDLGLARGSMSDVESASSGNLSLPEFPMSESSKSSKMSLKNGNVPPWAPPFMVNETEALDNMVRWMLEPEPGKRPSAVDILASSEVQWVEYHRKAGAVVYEGDYGPEPESDGENWRC